jgi:hypothetical protein
MKRIFFRLTELLSRRTPRATGVFAAAFGTVLLMPDAAFAQATYLGTVVCNVAANLNGNTPIVDLFDACAFISGTYLVGRSLYEFKEHADHTERMPLHKPIAKMTAAAGLLSLPYFVSWCVVTLFGQPGGGGVVACNPTAPAAVAADPSVIVTNFMGSIRDPMTFLVSIFAYTFGVFLIFRGLLKGSKINAERNTTTNIVANLVVGACLVAVGESANVILGTVFGNGATVLNAGTPGSTLVAGWAFVQQLQASPSFINAVAAALDFFQIIGLIAFVRGFMIIRNAVEGSGQATMAQGFTHVFGGILAMNIYQVLQIFNATLGTNWL